MTESATLYELFVIVAEDEWKLHCNSEEAIAKISAVIGGLTWESTLTNKTELTLSCKELRDGRIQEVNLELLLFYHNAKSFDEIYKKSVMLSPNPSHVVLNQQNATWSCTFMTTEYLLLNIRILKERNLFPDFTLDKPIGRFVNDVKLQVGEQLFHVNKQLLSLLSLYFDGLFNGSFKESKQDLVDTGESDPALYHDFLVALTAPNLCNEDVLPNRQNIAGMMRLAKYYQADRLLQHCERHLRMCREMPHKERVVLAKKYGSKDLQAALLFDVVLQNEAREVLLAFLEAEQ